MALQSYEAGVANRMCHDLVTVAGAAITSGVITFHLECLTGDNAGKYWNASGSSWSVSEVSAGSGTHTTNGRWYCSIAAGAWTTGNRYNLYAKTVAGNEITYSDEVIELHKPSNITVEGVVT